MQELAELTGKLGVNFHNWAILRQALTHSSLTNECPGEGNNERLEFLGDAVLGLVFADKLYRELPQANEGTLTHLRASLVRRSSLAAKARELDLGKYLRLGKGEEASGGRNKETNLAAALEALMGAIYLDQGFRTASEMALALFAHEVEATLERGAELDQKSRLQSLIQARGEPPPRYRIVSSSGNAHQPTFVAEVLVGETVWASGTGTSKKEAESSAARAALEKLETTPSSS